MERFPARLLLYTCVCAVSALFLMCFDLIFSHTSLSLILLGNLFLLFFLISRVFPFSEFCCFACVLIAVTGIAPLHLLLYSSVFLRHYAIDRCVISGLLESIYIIWYGVPTLTFGFHFFCFFRFLVFFFVFRLSYRIRLRTRHINNTALFTSAIIFCFIYHFLAWLVFLCSFVLTWYVGISFA